MVVKGGREEKISRQQQIEEREREREEGGGRERALPATHKGLQDGGIAGWLHPCRRPFQHAPMHFVQLCILTANF